LRPTRSGKIGAVCHDLAVQPDVSIVVVNYRSAELTVRALESAAASAGGARVEEIVVDNASGADDLELLRERRPGALLVASAENRGFAAGVNEGLARARGRTVLVLNPDTIAADDALARLLAYLDAHPRAGVVAPLLRNADGSVQLSVHRRFPNLLTLFVEFCAPLHVLSATRWHPHTLPLARLARPGAVAHAAGAALLVRTDAARAAGPLDERFFLYLEETEWQRRMARAGWEIHLEPAAEFMHSGQGSDADVEVVSPHYLDSAQRFFGPRARPVMRAGAVVSVWSARAARRLRPADPRFGKLERAYGRVREQLRQPAPPSARR
jgi:GT2 family glycosyltransferase